MLTLALIAITVGLCAGIAVAVELAKAEPDTDMPPDEAMHMEERPADKIVGHFSLVALGFVIAIVLGATA